MKGGKEDTKVRFIDLAELCRELNTLTNRQFRPGHQLVKLYHALSRFSTVSEYYKDEEQVLQLFNIYNLESKHTHPYVITQLAKIYQADPEDQKVKLTEFANRLDEHEQWEWESRRKAKTRRKAQLSLQPPPHVPPRVQSMPDLSSVGGGHPSPIPSPASLATAPISRAKSFSKLSLGANLSPPLDNESRHTSYSSISSEENYRHEMSHDFEHQKAQSHYDSDYSSDKSWPRISEWMGGLKKWWDGDDRERYEAEMFYREQQQKYGDFPPRHKEYPPMSRSKYGNSSFEGTRDHLTRSRQYFSMNDLSRLQFSGGDHADYDSHYYKRDNREHRERELERDSYLQHSRQHRSFHSLRDREFMYKGREQSRYDDRPPMRSRVLPAFPDDLDYQRFSRV